MDRQTGEHGFISPKPHEGVQKNGIFSITAKLS